MPAAYFSTPAGMMCYVNYCPSLPHSCSIDVVKTRLQTEARAGQTRYHGLRHAFVTICNNFELSVQNV
jgi:hypothetical protein